MFFRRRYDKEIMDDRTIVDDRLTRALDELRVINLFLGGRSTTTAGIRELLESIRSHPVHGTTAASQASGERGQDGACSRPLTILDVGSGGSDNFAAATAGSRAIEIISVDINPGACDYILAHDRERPIVCGDARALPFKPGSVDIVHVALFLHHFSEEEIGRMLQAFLGIARYGVVVNDLRRSYLALAGISLLTRVFSRSAMVRNDAPLSVKRGFVRADMLGLLRGLQCSSFTLHRRWAFRWLAVIIT